MIVEYRAGIKEASRLREFFRQVEAEMVSNSMIESQYYKLGPHFFAYPCVGQQVQSINNLVNLKRHPKIH